MVRISSITKPSTMRLGNGAPPGHEKVCHALNCKVCERDFAIKAFECGNAFDIIG